MRCILLFALLASSLLAEKSNGVTVETRETSEGITVSVIPSSCNVDFIQVRLVASRVGEGFKTYTSEAKRVGRCDQRWIEFRFDRPGTVSFIGVDEATITNTSTAK